MSSRFLISRSLSRSPGPSASSGGRVLFHLHQQLLGTAATALVPGRRCWVLALKQNSPLSCFLLLRVSLAARSTPFPSVNVPPSVSMFLPPPVPSQARSPSFCPPCLPDYRPTSGGAGLFSLHICVPSPSPPSLHPSFCRCSSAARQKEKRKEKRHKTTQVSRPTDVESVPVRVPRRNRKKSERNCDLELIDNGTSCPSIRRWPHHVARQSQRVSTLKKKKLIHALFCLSRSVSTLKSL